MCLGRADVISQVKDACDDLEALSLEEVLVPLEDLLRYKQDALGWP